MKNPIEDKLFVDILLNHLNVKQDFSSNRHFPKKETLFCKIPLSCRLFYNKN